MNALLRADSRTNSVVLGFIILLVAGYEISGFGWHIAQMGVRWYSVLPWTLVPTVVGLFMVLACAQVKDDPYREYSRHLFGSYPEDTKTWKNHLKAGISLLCTGGSMAAIIWLFAYIGWGERVLIHRVMDARFHYFQSPSWGQQMENLRSAIHGY